MKFYSTLLLMFLSGSIVLFGQDDSTVYRFGIPVSEDDTVQNFPPEDYAPGRKLERVTTGNLPAKLRKALSREQQYEGWEKLPVYYDRVNNLYLVRVKQDDDIITIGVTPSGKAVTYGEKTVQDN